MSQHGYPERLSSRSKTFQEDGLCQPTIEVLVETLTGTAFEMTVSPLDTVFAIKSKIFRVEGIPIAQQHLLYKLKELEDACSLRDARVTHGSTLRLVLGLRGGPIATRRLPPPSADHLHWRDFKDLVESSKDESLECLPHGCRVTVLVFREGDNVNFIRVIENEDGTYSPLNESTTGLKPTSAEGSAGAGCSDYEDSAMQENTVTMTKMVELRRRMESLTLQRRPSTSAHSRNQETSETESESIEKTLSEETVSMVNSLLEEPSNTAKYKTNRVYTNYSDIYSSMYDGDYTKYDYDCTFNDRYTLLPPISGYSDAAVSDCSGHSAGRDWHLEMSDLYNNRDGYLPSEYSTTRKSEARRKKFSEAFHALSLCRNMESHLEHESREDSTPGGRGVLEEGEGEPLLAPEDFEVPKPPLPSPHCTPVAADLGPRPLMGGLTPLPVEPDDARAPPLLHYSTLANTVTGVGSGGYRSLALYPPVVDKERPSTSSDHHRRLQLRKLIFGSNSQLNNATSLRNISKPPVGRNNSHCDSLHSSINDILTDNIGVATFLGSEPQINKLASPPRIEARKKTSKLSHSVSNLYLNSQSASGKSVANQEFSSSSDLDKAEVTVHENIFNTNNMNFSSSTSDLENLKRNKILPSLSRHRNLEHLDVSDECLDRVTITKRENENYPRGVDSDGSKPYVKCIAPGPSPPAGGNYDFVQINKLDRQTSLLKMSSGSASPGRIVPSPKGKSFNNNLQFFGNDKTKDVAEPFSSSGRGKIIGRLNRNMEVVGERKCKRVKKIAKLECGVRDGAHASPAPAFRFANSSLDANRIRTSDDLINQVLGYVPSILGDKLFRKLPDPDHSYSKSSPDRSLDSLKCETNESKKRESSHKPASAGTSLILPDIHGSQEPVLGEIAEATMLKQSKKQSRVRCGFCNKRLSIATTHSCRCGVQFCAPHRYSEVHGCSYDYKTEGQKFLQQANPLVSAPKLPKI